ncbi:EboA domain-containing protein [Flagellimonas sp.]|uniref:EboA domain-containing protein n=1 Tax=Flagellimonas sp. TaxID=2058762 RepID=UPI003BB108BB
MGDGKLDFTNCVLNKLSPKEQDWLNLKRAAVKESARKFPIFFSQASRFIANDVPEWNTDEIQILESIYPGFGSAVWTKRDMARTVLVCALNTNKDAQVLRGFFEIAEMNELVALYKSLFLLDNAADFASQVKEGVRTNMVNVFDAICLGNPFAAAYLEDPAWNQLVLKAIFMERPLYKIQNIDQRRNKELADMLQDYIQERWAAKRTVSPEVWRLVHQYLREDVKQLILEKELEAFEKSAIETILDSKATAGEEFWNNIGKMNEINLN